MNRKSSDGCATESLTNQIVNPAKPVAVPRRVSARRRASSLRSCPMAEEPLLGLPPLQATFTLSDTRQQRLQSVIQADSAEHKPQIFDASLSDKPGAPHHYDLTGTATHHHPPLEHRAAHMSIRGGLPMPPPLNSPLQGTAGSAPLVSGLRPVVFQPLPSFGTLLPKRPNERPDCSRRTYGSTAHDGLREFIKVGEDCPGMTDKSSTSARTARLCRDGRSRARARLLCVWLGQGPTYSVFLNTPYLCECNVKTVL
jgi:hypothetical protein